MPELCEAMTPTAVVEKLKAAGVIVSERSLRQVARRFGTFRVIGKAMFFMPEDIKALMVAIKPQPKIKNPTPKVANWTEDDTEALLARVTPKTKRKR